MALGVRGHVGFTNINKKVYLSLVEFDDAVRVVFTFKAEKLKLVRS